ncbi:hypothetical protein BMS3Abin17_00628 [archaeon BMS3Abin17]|nr:hypothetical protein BMS3Abin17_00628 [archaeon BMS3Abin17]HDZ60179.1 hypothetical protein [Candidatus Pacearchaeota archaeon]
MPEEEEKISKYSSGVNIIIRLDLLWKDTHLHSRQGRYSLWNTDLDRIWLELARDLNETRFKEVKKDFDEFDSQIENLGKVSDSAPEGFRELTVEEIKKRNELYEILKDKQLFLSRLENELGKGTTPPDKDDDGYD